MESWTRRSYGNWFFASNAAKWNLRDYYHRNWRILLLRICLSSCQPHGIKHSKSDHRYHDKTRFFTYILSNRKRKRFRQPSLTWCSRNTGLKFEASHNATCKNKSGPRAGPFHNQDLFENGIGRKQETMAQIFTLLWFSTRPIIPGLTVKQAEYFMAEFNTTS